jgi:hypothetical protein
MLMKDTSGNMPDMLPRGHAALLASADGLG